jgi:hypothetical protein
LSLGAFVLLSQNHRLISSIANLHITLTVFLIDAGALDRDVG